ncbi:hypothetical protein DFW101_2648 [Solidesulfovibrio carbinoliphilus subsp. oakridgensis]|uniref:Uncharacterized protein n=1 Tax=Solidesulfovibrio carbinoliphilus subsp. oakridgensis TaxID=694327 RepID=G7Q9L2_9BACT|nr:hypothetical protein [Solidesulfovibrio carbinoliphilus]EHJ48652.1 hypothetical protein DFW101_2648 [Solidesulfovibrio carbinoliphilus subsp. oakridgensis]
MARTGRGMIEALDRLGLLKYVLAALFAGTALALTVGAYFYEEAGHRPPRPVLPPPVLALVAAQAPVDGHVFRAPASRAVRFAAAPEPPAGFSFYDIAADETPASLAAKLARKRFKVGRGRGEACNFAYPLSDPAGGREAVAAFIRDRSRECCALAGELPGQLVTYAFSRTAAPTAAKAGPIAGAAVFSEVGAGLLTLNLRFSENLDGYQTALSTYLTGRFGPPSSLGQTGGEGRPGQAWAREGGLVTMVRNGGALSVTAYYAANIERHAALAAKLAGRPSPRPSGQAGGRLAMAVVP